MIMGGSRAFSDGIAEEYLMLAHAIGVGLKVGFPARSMARSHKHRRS